MQCINATIIAECVAKLCEEHVLGACRLIALCQRAAALRTEKIIWHYHCLLIQCR
jgi:hypothetical protein